MLILILPYGNGYHEGVAMPRTRLNILQTGEVRFSAGVLSGALLAGGFLFLADIYIYIKYNKIRPRIKRIKQQ